MILLFGLSLNVNAFGVSSPYWDENPLYMYAGETKEVVMVLQNMIGDQDLKVTVELNGGYEIATLLNQVTTYNVPLGSNNIPVKLKISIPQDAKPGQEWQVGISVKTIPENTGGVSVGTGISKGFKVIVKEQPSVSAQVTKPVISSKFLGFLVSAIILVILFMLIKYFHKKRASIKE